MTSTAPLLEKLDALVRTLHPERIDHPTVKALAEAAQCIRTIENRVAPAKLQPFDPPVPAVAVWAIPREGVSELTDMLYAYVTFGRDPHPSQVTNAQEQAFRQDRAKWEAGLLQFLQTLENVGHLSLTPILSPQAVQTETTKP